MVESDAHCHQFCWSMDEGGISIHKLQHHCVCVHNRTGTICVEAQFVHVFQVNIHNGHVLQPCLYVQLT